MKPALTEYTKEQQQALFGDGAGVSPILPYSYRKDYLMRRELPSTTAISVSGAQSKMSIIFENATLRFAEPGQQGTHILKPHPQRFALNRDVPANEEFCMRMCRTVFLIPTAESALCFLGDGAPAYLTRRFDILPDGSKLHMEDLASLAGMFIRGNSNAKYQGSYEELAEVIAGISCARLLDLRQFFRLVLVNFILCNGDAHAKNFSMIDTDNGAWRLAPAYDVMNTRLHVSDADFAMQNGLFRDGRVCPKSNLSDFFCSWGESIGLTSRLARLEIRQILAKTSAIIQALPTSHMSQKAQQVFRYHLKQRLQRF